MTLDEDLLECTLEDLHDIIRDYRNKNQELKDIIIKLVRENKK